MLVVYAAFVVWISLESFGVVDLVPSLPPKLPG
jgi:cation:H+ antiporter